MTGPIPSTSVIPVRPRSRLRSRRSRLRSRAVSPPPPRPRRETRPRFRISRRFSPGEFHLRDAGACTGARARRGGFSASPSKSFTTDRFSRPSSRPEVYSQCAGTSGSARRVAIRIRSVGIDGEVPKPRLEGEEIRGRTHRAFLVQPLNLSLRQPGNVHRVARDEVRDALLHLRRASKTPHAPTHRRLPLRIRRRVVLVVAPPPSGSGASAGRTRRTADPHEGTSRRWVPRGFES